MCSKVSTLVRLPLPAGLAHRCAVHLWNARIHLDVEGFKLFSNLLVLIGMLTECECLLEVAGSAMYVTHLITGESSKKVNGGILGHTLR